MPKAGEIGGVGQIGAGTAKAQADAKAVVTWLTAKKRTPKAEEQLKSADDILTEICKIHGLTVQRYRELRG